MTKDKERKITIEISDSEARSARTYVDPRPGEPFSMEHVHGLLLRIVGTWEDAVREEEAPDAQDEKG